MLIICSHIVHVLLPQYTVVVQLPYIDEWLLPPVHLLVAP